MTSRERHRADRRTPVRSAIVVAAVAIACVPVHAHARTCDGLPGADALDFWVGDWVVYVGDAQAGENHIEKILGGCAVTERWIDVRGNEGRSLFYLVPSSGTWKQVWVTANAAAPGGLKEKQLIGREADGALRFQGTVTLADGRAFLDRTTLTPLEDGRVRQVIETSTDGGATWETRFDGVYVRRDAGR